MMNCKTNKQEIEIGREGKSKWIEQGLPFATDLL